MDGFFTFPKCQKCEDGVLLVLSDYGPDGASVFAKAWACSDSACGFVLRIDKGVVTYDEVEGVRERKAAARGGHTR